MSRKLIPLAAAPAHGVPFTRPALNWIAFHRSFNGAARAGAIVKVGGRLFCDPERFLDWMASEPQISPPGARAQRARPRQVA